MWIFRLDNRNPPPLYLTRINTFDIDENVFNFVIDNNR